jgi:succinate dehydrogenase / fumarate reductase cytochrome b subunit
MRINKHPRFYFFGLDSFLRTRMAKPRPLSPHLQVYRPQLTSVMSIMHRASGVVLATGSLMLVVWLAALAAGADAFGFITAVLHHPLGQFVLFGYSLALVYHGLNGIRHLLWDLRIGLEIRQVYQSGYLVLSLTVLVTAALWLLV